MRHPFIALALIAFGLSAGSYALAGGSSNGAYAPPSDAVLVKHGTLMGTFSLDLFASPRKPAELMAEHTKSLGPADPSSGADGGCVAWRTRGTKGGDQAKDIVKVCPVAGMEDQPDIKLPPNAKSLIVVIKPLLTP